jgi:hypothetical protein
MQATDMAGNRGIFVPNHAWATKADCENQIKIAEMQLVLWLGTQHGVDVAAIESVCITRDELKRRKNEKEM